MATTTLSLGIRDMRRHKVLIRHLDAVETLGALQTICLDKTGTITRNEMVVVEIVTGMRSLKVEGERFAAPGGYVSPSACMELQRLLMMSVLCNETEIYREGEAYKLHGTPTEAALVHLALKAGIDVAGLQAAIPGAAHQLPLGKPPVHGHAPRRAGRGKARGHQRQSPGSPVHVLGAPQE